MPTEPTDKEVRHCNICKKQWMFKVYGDECPTCQGLGNMGFLKEEAPIPLEHKMIGLSNYKERQEEEPATNIADIIGIAGDEHEPAVAPLKITVPQWAQNVVNSEDWRVKYEKLNAEFGQYTKHAAEKGVLDHQTQITLKLQRDEWEAKYDALVKTNEFMIKHNQDHMFKLNVIITFLKAWHEERELL